jgi:hypothetical protein
MSKKEKIDKNSNFLDLIPDKLCKWEKDGEGIIRLVVPRFKNHTMRKIAVNLGRSENIKIALDNLGSKVWELIDGSRTVGQIGQILEKEAEVDTGQPMPQVYERLTRFLSGLSHHRLIDLKSI